LQRGEVHPELAVKGAAEAADRIRHFEPGPTHREISPRGAGAGESQPVKRARGGPQRVRRNVGVATRGLEAAVSEQDLDRADVGAGFEQLRGEAVAVIPRSE
jgi:hypothetical protein